MCCTKKGLKPVQTPSFVIYGQQLPPAVVKHLVVNKPNTGRHHIITYRTWHEITILKWQKKSKILNISIHFKFRFALRLSRVVAQ